MNAKPTPEDHLDNDQFLLWYYTGEGNYCDEVLRKDPTVEKSLDEARNRLEKLTLEVPVPTDEDVEQACNLLREAIQKKTHAARRRKALAWSGAAAAMVIAIAMLRPVGSNSPTPQTFSEEGTDYMAMLHEDSYIFRSGESRLYSDNRLMETFPDNPHLDYSVLNEDVPTIQKLVVAYGERASVKLKDGTQVLANSGTVLLFPSSFSTGERTVYIDGEAFIDVVPDPGRPFIVKTTMMDVNVLGTAFNVSAYSGEAQKSITLSRGKVRVTSPAGEQIATLSPSEHLSVKDGSIKVQKVDVEEFTSWTHGTLSFRNTELSEILRHVSRYYNVDIRYEGPETITCSGKLELSGPIRNVIAAILQTAPVRMTRKNNNTYIITLK